MIFKGTSWRVELPDGWDSWRDPECDAMVPPTDLGVLQISAARNMHGPATDQDLLDLMERNEQEAATRVDVGGFVGYYCAIVEDGTHWRRWVLRHDDMAVFVTYNCDVQDAGRENRDIDEVLATLQPRPNRGAARDRGHKAVRAKPRDVRHGRGA